MNWAGAVEFLYPDLVLEFDEIRAGQVFHSIPGETGDSRVLICNYESNPPDIQGQRGGQFAGQRTRARLQRGGGAYARQPVYLTPAWQERSLFEQSLS